MQSVGVLALPNCLLTGVIGPLEIFAIANSMATDGTPVFDPMDIIGLKKGDTINFSGIPIPVQSTLEDAIPDIVILPPIFAELDKALDNRRLIDWLKARHEAGAIIATSCAGSFLLAETGLLDNRTATTHWKLVPLFRERYPEVDLQPRMMLIDGGSYVCAGGAMAWQDLALHLVARFISPEVASTTAKLLVMDGTRHVQTPYFMFEQQEQDHSDASVHAVQKWLQAHYHEPLTIDEMAEIAELGTRTFLRRFKRATGQTPLSYLQQLRIESARHLLEVSTKNIEEITGLTGYADSSSFRRLFKEKTGLTPKEYRSRFHRLT
ncbi:GlxA family transcriptional regulator [Pseudodesulfovibrio sp. zrk46]|uniref:GlxA family transcriptional regulator n=1 Tax=Pseudodesulfovibrio sp. zrk46 TaxID=2725288 RepID=UPI00144936C1|nr:GlxA family transcriptional regulator [Pseudodesulfovibrio sp. zrk46]QJB55580.1 GlxA family transcriptional regulator [Pseudodesulfovibrio sp. zrk46]